MKTERKNAIKKDGLIYTDMKSRVHNPKYLEKYFTQFPNIIDDSELTPYEYRLLIHYYRVGECWEGVRKTSEICKMSTGKVADCRKSLEEKGFITIEQNGDGIIITLVDLSAKNLEKYAGPTVHVVNTPVHVVNKPRSCGEHKNNHIKKNNIVESEDSTFQKPLSKAKKEAKPKDPVFTQCVELWLKTYREGWIFGGAQGKALKSIITKIKTSCKNAGLEGTEGQMIASFKKMMDNLPEFYRAKDLMVIDSKFNEIITEIQHGKQAQNFNSKNSADRFSDFA